MDTQGLNPIPRDETPDAGTDVSHEGNLQEEHHANGNDNHEQQDVEGLNLSPRAIPDDSGNDGIGPALNNVCQELHLDSSLDGRESISLQNAFGPLNLDRQTPYVDKDGATTVLKDAGKQKKKSATTVGAGTTMHLRSHNKPSQSPPRHVSS